MWDTYRLCHRVYYYMICFTTEIGHEKVWLAYMSIHTLMIKLLQKESEIFVRI